MSPDEIKFALERRGAHLNRGIEMTTALKIANTKNINVDSYILDIFSKFNGFQEGALDPGSSIRIWPFEDILDRVLNGQNRTSFADFLINSNEYTFDLEDASAFLDDESTIVAESFLDFLDRLQSGHFDF